MLLPLLLAAASPADAPIEKQDRAALERVSRDLCRRQVAVLGEATHADGHSEAFKVALVERLVTRCGFRAVVFEGSMYEFIGFDRAKREGRASEAMLGNAIGGLWKFETEVKPLVGFLYREAMAGRVTLGGMDDQIGGLEQPFGNAELPGLLTRGLAGERREVCRKSLADRVQGGALAEADRQVFRGCVVDIRGALTGSAIDWREQGAMLDALEHVVARRDLSRLAYKQDRDRAMYETFARFVGGLPRGTRTIVWTHNVHAAKSAAVNDPGDDAPIFGTLLARAYGKRAFSLGLTARGGVTRVSRKEVPLPPPSEGALERVVPVDGETAYLDTAALRARGAVPAGFNNHVYRTARWADVYDGAVVFADERSPHSTRVYPAP